MASTRCQNRPSDTPIQRRSRAPSGNSPTGTSWNTARSDDSSGQSRAQRREHRIIHKHHRLHDHCTDLAGACAHLRGARQKEPLQTKKKKKKIKSKSFFAYELRRGPVRAVEQAQNAGLVERAVEARARGRNQRCRDKVQADLGDDLARGVSQPLSPALTVTSPMAAAAAAAAAPARRSSLSSACVFVRGPCRACGRPVDGWVGVGVGWVGRGDVNTHTLSHSCRKPQNLRGVCVSALHLCQLHTSKSRASRLCSQRNTRQARRRSLKPHRFFTNFDCHAPAGPDGSRCIQVTRTMQLMAASHRRRVLGAQRRGATAMHRRCAAPPPLLLASGGVSVSSQASIWRPSGPCSRLLRRDQPPVGSGPARASLRLKLHQEACANDGCKWRAEQTSRHRTSVNRSRFGQEKSQRNTRGRRRDALTLLFTLQKNSLLR